MNHENIVRVHELYIDVVKGKIYTVMELVNGGEMFETIKNSGSYTGRMGRILNYFYRRNYKIDVYLNPIGYPIPCIALYNIK